MRGWASVWPVAFPILRNMMDIERAIRIAEMWEAGKLIGADEDEVMFALLTEVKRLRALLEHSTSEASQS
jgi:hypothetical protein